MVAAGIAAIAAFATLAPAAVQDPAAVPPAAAATVPLPAAAEIEAAVARLQRERGVTALLVGVWHGEEEILATAAGTSMTGVPASPDMHFRIGAMAISSLTNILLQLVDEGVVSLDDPLGKWFPHYPEADEVTLRMLAGSSAGYADYVTDEDFVAAFVADVFADWTAEELVRIGLDRGMVFPPGTGFQYAHTNYILLAEALVAATGTPLEELVEARIIGPLGLGETSYWTTPALDEPVLHAFTTERGIFEDSTFWNPSWTSATGFLNADLRDLGRLTRALANGEMISQESYQELLAPTNVGKGGNTAERYYGLGIAKVEPWLMQFFSFGGYGGTVGYLPTEDLTVTVVTTLGPTSSLDENPSTPIFAEIRAALGR
jgi:D-alanyl-D-alanine carboxypeptidase